MKLPLRRPAAMLTAAVATLAVTLPGTALANQPGSPFDKNAKEYSLEQYAVPADIATGPDGALYAPDGSLSRLWRITTKGKVSSIPLGVGPAGVATGPDDALWVTDRSLDQIHRVSPDGDITSYQLPTAGAFPTDIVAGPDGALWFTESRGDQIGRITTQGDVTEYPLETAGAFAADITVGSDGALWFTESSGNKVGRITTSGELTEYPLETPDSLPGPIVTGQDGALYFSERNSLVITRMTTAGTITRRTPLPSGFGDPVSLAATRHGLYVADHRVTDGFIAPMSLSGVFGRAARTKSAPDAITVGPDGAVWYVSGNEAKVGRLPIDS